MTPTNAPTATPITFSPSSVSTGSYAKTDVTLSGANFSATSATVADPSIATVVKTNAGFSIITAGTAGSTTVQFSDGLHAATLGVTNNGTAPTIDPHVVGLGAGVVGIGVGLITLQPSEAGYGGTFSVWPFPNNIVTIVSPALPVLPYLVTTVSAGSTYVTVADNAGHSTYVGLQVQGP